MVATLSLSNNDSGQTIICIWFANENDQAWDGRCLNASVHKKIINICVTESGYHRVVYELNDMFSDSSDLFIPNDRIVLQ